MGYLVPKAPGGIPGQDKISIRIKIRAAPQKVSIKIKIKIRASPRENKYKMKVKIKIEK